MRKHRQNWLDVFCGFRVALDARKIVLGTLGTFVSIIVLLGLLSLAANWWPRAQGLMGDLLTKPARTVMVLGMVVVGKILPGSVLGPSGASAAYGLREAGFVLLSTVLMLFIWSFFGGAIARLAAVDFARDERVPVGEATSFAARKFGSFFWSPLVPLVFVVFFLLCNYVLGLAGRIPYAGPVIVGLFFVLAALSAFVTILLLLTSFCGFIFMWPTIAMEGTDAFDAISRAFNYLFARPWKTIWCGLMACVYGVVVIAFVAVFALLMLQIAIGSVAVGMGQDFRWIGQFVMGGTPVSGGGWTNVIGMILIKMVLVLTWGLVMGFVVSYKISAMTIIYSILRRDVDGTEMNEVYLPEAEETPEPPVEEPKATPAPEPKPETSEQKPTA